MGSAIDGLISGLDTTTIITQLMTLEALPQTQLKAKVTTTDSIVTSLQALNTKLSSLGDSAKTAATAASWQAVGASSSANSVTATTTTGAQPSSLTFTVNALAAKQTSVSATTTDLASFFPDDVVPTTLTLATGPSASASLTEIDLAGVSDLAGLAGAINDADAGVTATIVKISATESRLQLTANESGSDHGFDLYSGSVTDAYVQDPASSASGLMGRKAGTLIGAAADAQITLWANSGAPVPITSPTNTFAGVLTGIDFTISKVEADPVTLTVARNNTALTTLASNLVTNISTVLSEIVSRTKSSISTVDGREVTKPGILSGDSAVRSVQQSVVTAASDPVNGISPSTVGIVLGKDGTITFDATIFAAALAADPDKVQAVISGLAERLQTVSTNLSDKTTGAITLKIQGQQSYTKSLGDQVLNWDNRLEMRQAALEKQYAALEVALGKLGSQSDWLTSQLDSMNANN